MKPQGQCTESNTTICIGLAIIPMENEIKPLINLVITKRRKIVIRLAKMANYQKMVFIGRRLVIRCIVGE